MPVAACSDFLRPSELGISLIFCQAWSRSRSKTLTVGNNADGARIGATFSSLVHLRGSSERAGSRALGLIVGLRTEAARLVMQRKL